MPSGQTTTWTRATWSPPRSKSFDCRCPARSRVSISCDPQARERLNGRFAWTGYRSLPLPADVEETLRARARGAAELVPRPGERARHQPRLARLPLALRDECDTPRALRELVILRTAVRHGSEYEWHHHEAMALAAGVTPEKLEAVRSWRTRGVFDASERAALALTDAICDAAVSDETWAEAARWFDPSELVELVVTAATYVMVPRVLEALAVPTEAAAADGTGPPAAP